MDFILPDVWPQHLNGQAPLCRKAENINGGIDFIGGTNDLNSNGFLFYIHDFAFKNIDQLKNLVLRGLAEFQGHQQQFSLNMLLVGEVGHLYGVDEPVQLLEHLADNLVITTGDNGHAGDFRILSLSDGDALKIEAAGAEH